MSDTQSLSPAGAGVSAGVGTGDIGTFPVPPPASGPRSSGGAITRNVLDFFPPAAFDDEFVTRRRFGRHQIILSRPSAIGHILVDNPGNYRRTSATIRLLYPIVGDGLLLAEGEAWRAQRRTLAPAFGPRTVPLLARHVAAVAERLAADIESEIGAAGGVARVDLFDRLRQAALEIAGASMFSLEMAAFGPRLRAELAQYAERLGRLTMLDILLPPAIPTPRDLARRRFRRGWMALVGEIVAARREAGSAAGPRDLLDLLGEACPTDRVLADQVATMIVAGHATTALALFWSLYILARMPDMQDRVAREVKGLDLDPPHAAAALAALPFTRAVVQEALRLYPPAHVIVRQARRADDAGGIAIPRGAVVMMAPWVLHRHRNLWREPDRFDPRRFLPGATPPDRFAYLPFGAGPRICIGAQFALTEAVLVVAKLVQAFRVGLTGTEPVRPVAIVTLQPETPPEFRLERRAAADPH